ncbi:MAG: proton-conducting transporter membrane subunit [Pseudomonadota bacterium]
MMLWFLLMVPTLAGLVCFVQRSSSHCRIILCAVAFLHCMFVLVCWVQAPISLTSDWLGLDDTGLVFLTMVSLLFMATSVYTFGYLKSEDTGSRKDLEENIWFRNSKDSVFTGCMLLFLATMTLVTVSRHLGLMWVAIEATTLSSAPLIYYHRHHRSLEAVWKYLLICSVGIALAMLGNFFMIVAGAGVGPHGVHLSLKDLTFHAPELNPVWLKAAFVLCLVGYGTKMGLAPMHNWLPDAHSEAPSSVSALLSGALLNCAFLVLFRIHIIMTAAGQGATSSFLFTLLGVASIVVAAVFIVGQTDYKRMLAYSSVEHMGIIALGIGVGGVGVVGSLFHVINHSLVKGMLFMTAGNIMAAFKSKRVADVRGLLKVRPVTAVLLVTGAFAILGTPPFGTFFSEFTILKGMVDSHRYILAVVYLLSLGVIFVAFSAKIVFMVFSRSPFGKDQDMGAATGLGQPEPVWSTAPLMVLGALALGLGLYTPVWLLRVLYGITYLGGS